MVDEFEKLVIRMNPPRFVSPNPDTHGCFFLPCLTCALC